MKITITKINGNSKYLILCSYFVGSGRLYTGLTKQYEKTLSKALGTKLDRAFWMNYSVKIPNSLTGLKLETKKPGDMLKYLFLVSHKHRDKIDIYYHEKENKFSI